MSISRGLVRRLNEERRREKRRREKASRKSVKQKRQAKSSRKSLNGSETAMRYLVMVKGNKEYEAGAMPSEQELAEMGKFNDELVKAGVMLAGEGLQPSAKGARIRNPGGQRTVRDGPFTEAKEVGAGVWIWQVQSRPRALQGAKRIPVTDGELGIPQL